MIEYERAGANYRADKLKQKNTLNTLIHNQLMKVKHITLAAMAAATLITTSCTSMGDLDTVSASELGSVSRTVPATVTAARYVQAASSSETNSWGTALGAALGAGAGQLLGKGSGRIASTAGFGLAGAVAGRAAASQFKTHAQELTVKINGTKREYYTVTQPVYKQYGAIPVGTRGMLHVGSKTSRFIPN